MIIMPEIRSNRTPQRALASSDSLARLAYELLDTHDDTSRLVTESPRARRLGPPSRISPRSPARWSRVARQPGRHVVRPLVIHRRHRNGSTLQLHREHTTTPDVSHAGKHPGPCRKWNSLEPQAPERRNPRDLQGFRAIGAPRFELGTSPTRTVRATRLRHAPTEPSSIPQRRRDGTLAPRRAMPAATADIIAFLDELLEIDRFEDYGPTACRSPAPQRSTTVVTGVSAQRELFERALERGRPARARPPRHPVGLRAAPHRPRAGGPPEAAARQRHRARRLPPAARRPPASTATTRCSPSALGADQPRARVRLQGPSRSASIARFDGDGVAAARAVRARRASVTEREPLVFDAGPARVRTLGIVSGGGRRLRSRTAIDARARRLPHRRAEGARDGAGARERHPLHRGRPLRDRDVRRSAASASSSRERFGVRHVFVDIPNPV